MCVLVPRLDAAPTDGAEEAGRWLIFDSICQGLSEGLGLGLDCGPLVVYVRAVFVSAPCLLEIFAAIHRPQIAFGRRTYDGRSGPEGYG